MEKLYNRGIRGSNSSSRDIKGVRGVTRAIGKRTIAAVSCSGITIAAVYCYDI